MSEYAATRESFNASRRVANMTATQIESKRSIDRANQRFCRAKRRSQVDQLWQQVESLTQELEDARRQLRDYHEREKAWNSALPAWGLSSDNSSNHGSASTCDYARDQLPSVGLPFNNNSPLQTGAELVVSARGSASTNVSVDLDPVGDSFDSSVYQPTRLDFDWTTSINVNLVDPTRDLDSSLSGIDWCTFEPNTSPSRPLSWSGHFLLDKFDPPLAASESAEWKLIPPLIAATTQLDQVILSTTEALRLSGFKTPQEESAFPSMSSLLNPTGSQDKPGSCSISEAAAAQVGRSPVASTLARVGFMYVLSHLLRWYICRTKESYDQLPSYIRPTLLQRTIPHPPWIDVIVWPEIRDAIIQHMDWSRFLELRTATAKSLCVGWPHADVRGVFESADGKNYRLTGAFERHLRDERNWTVGADAPDVFPFLKPVCRGGP